MKDYVVIDILSKLTDTEKEDFILSNLNDIDFNFVKKLFPMDSNIFYNIIKRGRFKIEDLKKLDDLMFDNFLQNNIYFKYNISYKNSVIQHFPEKGCSFLEELLQNRSEYNKLKYLSLHSALLFYYFSLPEFYESSIYQAINNNRKLFLVLLIQNYSDLSKTNLEIFYDFNNILKFFEYLDFHQEYFPEILKFLKLCLPNIKRKNVNSYNYFIIKLHDFIRENEPFDLRLYNLFKEKSELQEREWLLNILKSQHSILYKDLKKIKIKYSNNKAILLNIKTSYKLKKAAN